MEADSIAGAEYTEPADSRFSGAQQRAMAQRIRDYPGCFVWIICDTPEKWHVMHAPDRVSAQAEIGRQCEDWRVWVVHTPRARPAKYQPDEKTPVSSIVDLPPIRKRRR